MKNVWKCMFRGVYSILFAWVIGAALFSGLIWLIKSDASWYMVGLFAAVPWAMIGVIGNDIDERKKVQKLSKQIEALEM